jgi:hypothetical protein
LKRSARKNPHRDVWVGPERLVEIECREVRRRQGAAPDLSKISGKKCEPRWYHHDFQIRLPKADYWPDPLIVSRLLGRLIRKDGEILRPLTVLDFTESLGSDAALEQFAYRCCPARHSLCKSLGIDDPQFLVREHDLKPLASVEFTHVPLAEPTPRAAFRSQH